MRKEGWIEVQSKPQRPGPGNPMLEMLDRQGIAPDFLPSGFGVGGMEVETMFAGYQGKGFLEVAAQFLRRAGFAGVAPGDGEATAQCPPGLFEPAHIIALPAMD